MDDIELGDVSNKKNTTLRQRLTALSYQINHHDKFHRHLSRFFLEEQKQILEISHRKSFCQLYFFYIVGFLFIGTVGRLTSFMYANERQFLDTSLPRLHVTFLDCAYYSWVTMTTIGYGDVSASQESTGYMRLGASIYMILTVVFVSRGMGAMAAHARQESTRVATTLRETSKNNRSTMRLSSALLRHFSAYSTLVGAAFFAEICSAVFHSTENWNKDNSGRFVFMKDKLNVE